MVKMDQYRLWIFPIGYHRRGRRKWLRLALVITLIAAAVPATLLTGWLSHRLSCRDGWPSDDIWSQDGDCVGITSDSYAFGIPALEPVMARITEQNSRAYKGSCDPDIEPVTVAVMSVLESDQTGGRSVQEIEGFAAAQARANSGECKYPVRLKIANMGRDEQAAVEVARRLKGDPEVVAVVGMGLSDQLTADAADELGSGDEPMPMVASLITAEGFDADGSKTDDPDYSECDNNATYKDGVGGKYFRRISYRNAMQITALAATNLKPTLVITPKSNEDPYPCTALPLVKRKLGDPVEAPFDPDDSATVRDIGDRVCRIKGQAIASYIARSRDLARLLFNLGERYEDNNCDATSILVVSTSDAVRMRVPEPDGNLEEYRTGALKSAAFRDHRIRLVYTPLADADSLNLKNSNEYQQLKKWFNQPQYPVSHLEGGWAINAYDALHVVTEAILQIRTEDKVSRATIDSKIAAMIEVPGASGPITFDSAGNRTDMPTVVELCPASDERTAPTSVVINSAKPVDRTQCSGT